MNRRLKYSKVFPFLLIVFALGGAATPTWAEELFSWDADQLSSTSIGRIFDVGMFTSIDSAEKHQGSGSMRLEVPGNIQGSMGIEPGNRTLPGGCCDGSSLYYRWWMRFSPSFSWGNANAKMKSNRVKQLGDIRPAIYTIYLHKVAVYVGECAGCGPGGDDPSNARVNYNFNPSSNSKITGWHEYIVHIKKQSAVDKFDGEFHFYVDGLEIGSGVSGMRYVNHSSTWVEGWGTLMVRPYPQLNDASAGGTIWIDDVSLATTFNSSFAPGTMPLEAPTNLTVK